MAIQIKDGTGNSYNAKVDAENRLWVEAQTIPTTATQSQEGETYSVTSHDATAAAGTYIIYFKNDDADKLFFIDLMRLGGVATILWKVWEVTGTAAGGSALTPSNLNLQSGKAASATARGDDSITGLSTVVELATIRTAANSSGLLELDDALILGQGDAIAVEVDAAGSTDVAEVHIRGFYKELV